MEKQEKIKQELKKHGINFEGITNPGPGNCFGCSLKNQRGLQLEVKLIEKKMVSYTILSDDFSGFNTIAHGGIVATLLDEISAWTVLSNLSKQGVTLDAHIKFYKPVFLNTLIKIVGELIDFNGKRATVRSTILNLNDEILAEADTNFQILEIKSLAKLVNEDESKLRAMFDGLINAFK